VSSAEPEQPAAGPSQREDLEFSGDPSPEPPPRRSERIAKGKQREETPSSPDPTLWVAPKSPHWVKSKTHKNPILRFDPPITEATFPIKKITASSIRVYENEDGIRTIWVRNPAQEE
jgi:hypothetical protein